MKKFSVITPCLNAEMYIEDTIKSIINQTAVIHGKIILEYIICDGGSSDNTCKIAELLLKDSRNCNWQILSEKDKGMYQAIVKGLKLITGDICSYLNAGDLLAPSAFDVLLELFNTNKVKWVTGLKVVINEDSQIVRVRLPFKYRRSFVRKGYYGEFLPFIQQDSTFWRSELNNMLDYDYLSSLTLAGDYYLWHRFSSITDLFIVSAYISGFKIHHGQKSEDKKAYRNEKLKFLNRNIFILVIDLPIIIYDWIFFFADHLKNLANRTTLIEYDHKNKRWNI
jgi:glycosyltransferase involved in cell wall biosynthesis